MPVDTINCIVCGNEAIDDQLLLSIEIAPDIILEYECCQICYDTVTQDDIQSLCDNELKPVISGMLSNMRKEIT